MRTLWLKSLALSALLAPQALLAQEGDLFGKLDKNSDGQIAADEVDEQGKGLFERLLRNGDENKDGKLSKEEFTAAMKRRPGGDNAPAGGPGPGSGAGPRGNVEEIFQRADANGDGKITKEEAPERMRENFDRLDANGDGAIEKAEFARALGRLMAAGGQPGGPAMGPRPEFVVGAMVLKALDADGNGEISASEIADAPKVLAKFDKNSDGKLDKEEMLAQAPRPEGRPGAPGAGRPGAEAMAQRLKEADKNGDGKLSKEEAPERLQQVFDRIDGNSDGQIDAAEMREFFQRARPNAQ